MRTQKPRYRESWDVAILLKIIKNLGDNKIIGLNM